MKNAYNTTLVLTIVGFAVLLAGSFYFGAPLFGWIIMVAIFAVFVVEQVIALKKIRQISVEENIVDSCKEQGTFSVDSEGVVGKRLSMAKHLMENGIRLDSPIAFEVLTSGSSIYIPRSSSGTVILLGLMGTFFGLMSSVATAGGAIDNSSTQGTLDTIQMLFQNMKGIFGTSLCGLFAALILNACRNILIAKRDAFMARLDDLTLGMQGAESSSEEEDKSEIERLFSLVSRNLNDVVNSVQQSLIGVVDKVGEELSSTTGKLSEEFSSVAKSMTTSVSQAFSPMEESVKALSASVENIPSRLDEKFNGLSENLKSGLENISAGVKGGLENVTTAASKDIAASVSNLVQQSNEQWGSFMDRLSAEASSNAEAEREGLETLKNVALQVAEKAQNGSAELSQSVSEKLNALSTDILAAFQKLSDTSATLLEAQKALTESIDNRVVKEKEATDALGGNIVETAELMRVNQSELSANLEMLRSALETILEKLSGDTAEHDEEENFVERLNQSLEAFHERASEVLMENAVKTQEILLEVLEQTQRTNVSQPKVEG